MRKPDLRDVAAEIARRVPASFVIRLSTPPTPAERLQLLAARLAGRRVAIMPHKCATVDEWLERYGDLKTR